MDFDDDAPPELIDTTATGEDGLEEVTVKVPITIVTGNGPLLLFSVHRILNTHRILGCGENDIIELHPDRTTWKEDCRHHEWYEGPSQSR